jgi:hypothetical protein
MKKLAMVLLVLAVFAAPAFSFDLGVNYTKEMGGFQRDFFGATVRSVGDGFLGFDLTVITPSLTSYSDPIENVKYLIAHVQDVEYAQILPYLLVNLRMKPLTIYGGIAPMIDLTYLPDVNGDKKFDVALYSPYMYQAKVGAELNLLFLGAYAEAGTIIDLTFKSAFDNYHFTLGAVLHL